MRLGKLPMISLLFASLLVLVAGCGQKGDLYLPEEAPEQQQEKK